MSLPHSTPTSAPAPPCLAASATQTEWFSREVHAHDAQLKSYLRGFFPSVRDIDDVVQESYLRTWRARLGQPIRSAKSFLFEIARNLAVDGIRRKGVSPEIHCPDLDALPVREEKPGVEDTVCTNEELDLLAQAIQSLPTRCREVMILRQIKGRSQKGNRERAPSL